MKLIKKEIIQDQLIEDVFPLQQKGHKIRTRRDLFAQGFYGMGAYIALPSIASLAMEKVAFGECEQNDSELKGLAGMMCFDLAGGWLGAGSNVIVGSNNSQTNFLPNYQTNGLPDALHPNRVGVNEEFGLRFHPNSAFLAGLRETTSATTRANIEGAVFTTISMDDSDNNTHSPVFAISRAAERGKLVNILGTNPNNVAGARAQSPAEMIDAANRAITIRNEADAVGIVQLGQLTSSVFANDKNSAEIVMNKIKQLSNSRLAKFNEQDMPRQLKELVECGYINATGFFKKYSETALDPRSDPMVRGTAAAPGAFERYDANGNNVFNAEAINFGGNGNMNGTNVAQAQTISKLIIDGLASVGTIILGGYDYHNNPRAVTDGRDYRAGKLVGASLELAAKKGENFCVYVYSDGGISTGQAADASGMGVVKFQATSDSGTRSIAFMLAYGAHGKPEVRNEGRQVGSFNTAGGVDRGFNLITNSTENLTKAVIANYLALHGKEGDLDKYVASNPFGSDLDKYLVFNQFKKPA